MIECRLGQVVGVNLNSWCIFYNDVLLTYRYYLQLLHKLWSIGRFGLVADHMILLSLHSLADDLTEDIMHWVDRDDAKRWRSRDMITSWRVSQRTGKQCKAMTNLHCLFTDCSLHTRIRSSLDSVQIIYPRN